MINRLETPRTTMMISKRRRLRKKKKRMVLSTRRSSTTPMSKNSVLCPRERKTRIWTLTTKLKAKKKVKRNRMTKKDSKRVLKISVT